MRAINKSEINLFITKKQHILISRLKETGINMSAIARLAIRKHGQEQIEITRDTAGKVRVVLYLEEADLNKLHEIANREGIKNSQALRYLISRYLDANEKALLQLI